MRVNLLIVSQDELQRELLRRSHARTGEAIKRAEFTLEALQKKHHRQAEEGRRLCRRIATAQKEAV